MSTVIKVLAAVASGILLYLSFPPAHVTFLIWIGLVPLFLVVLLKASRYAFVYSLVCGIVFFLGIFHWILEVPGYTWLHHGILAFYLGSYFGFFGLAVAMISNRSGLLPALIAAPFIWVSLEYIRSNLFFLALPWGLLGHSQYLHPTVIQIAAITGAYGVSFLIVAVNAVLAAFTHHLLGRFNKGKTGPRPLTWSSGRKTVVVMALALTSATLIYGHLIISEPLADHRIKLSLVQGNIEQSRKWDTAYAALIMKTYTDLTAEASKDGPGLIVWPETATPRPINRSARLYRQVKAIAKESGSNLLLGSSQRQKFERDDSREAKYLNSAYLFRSEGRGKNQRYDKIRLLPFGEYLPLKDVIPWSLLKIDDFTGYKAGEEYTVFELPTCRFGVTICWENLFPDLVRRFVQKGAQFIVNITNEAWFGRTAAPYQFLSMSVFRAVENRIYVVRCANTGISCFIDPYGRVVKRLRDESGQDIFVAGVLSGWVVPLKIKTFYTRHGDWLAWLSLACSLVFMVLAAAKIRLDAVSM